MSQKNETRLHWQSETGRRVRGLLRDRDGKASHRTCQRSLSQHKLIGKALKRLFMQKGRKRPLGVEEELKLRRPRRVQSEGGESRRMRSRDHVIWFIKAPRERDAPCRLRKGGQSGYISTGGERMTSIRLVPWALKETKGGMWTRRKEKG